MQRRAGVKSREPVSWEKASLPSSRYPPQNTSFLPALLGGCGAGKQRDTAFQTVVAKHLVSLPLTQSFRARNMAHPGQGWACTQSVHFLRGGRPWRGEIILAMDVNAARNTCFAQRETQMPVLHLSPALWCRSFWVLLSFSQEPLSVLFRSLCL